MVEYINPWHKSGRPEYGPKLYSTEASPTHYRGMLIYRRLDSCWDVVLDGTCITQCAGIGGAKLAIDKRLEPYRLDVGIKPAWDEAPEWANWLAMDCDGWWIWYKNEPEWSDSFDAWLHEGQWKIAGSNGLDDQGLHFASETLERRPGSV